MNREGDELEESLQLPVQGLFADLSTGEASVSFCDEMLALHPLLRARLSQQWLQSIRRFQQAAARELFVEQVRRNPKLSRSEQSELFRTTCSAFGFEPSLDNEC